MRWNLEARYRILLKINNAIVNQTTRDKLFRALAIEMLRHFQYDRLSINLYDLKTESLSYFAAADGIAPDGISCSGSRPVAEGAIAQMAISSKQPVIINDLSQYEHLPSVPSMLKSGLMATMAFPLMVRSRMLGTMHFSFKRTPDCLSELTEVLTDVSKQVAIAVDNMMAYTELKSINENLERQKRYLMANSEDSYHQEQFFYVSAAMAEIMNQIQLVADTDASGTHYRGDRHREGVFSSRNPRPEFPQRPSFRENQLPGPRRFTFRERTLRTWKGRFYRRE